MDNNKVFIVHYSCFYNMKDEKKNEESKKRSYVTNRQILEKIEKESF